MSARAERATSKLTLFDERVQVRQLAEGGEVRNDTSVGHVLVQLSLQIPHDVLATRKLPQEVRQRRRRSVNSGNARTQLSAQLLARSCSLHSQVTHAFGDDFLRRQGLLSARNAVLQHPLDHGHLFRLLSEGGTGLDLDSDVIKVSPHELGSSCQMWLRR